jgi:hypothetical protein
MARSALTVQTISLSGVTPSYAAANVDGHEFTNDGKTFLQVKNTSGSPITVTLQTPATVDGVALADPTVSVPATTGDKMIGPFPTRAFNQSGGVVYVDFSAVTNVTVSAFHLG